MWKNSYKKFFVPLIVSFLSISLFSCSSDTSIVTPNRDNAHSMSTSSVDSDIVRYEQIIEENPQTISPYTTLSSLYFQKIRETADISYYETIEDLMDKAESIEANNPDILSERAQIAIGRHDFRQWKEMIEKALLINPNRAMYYGILGDSDIELGLYSGALDAIQKMIDIRPDYSSYIRVAYLRELYGDIQWAREWLAMTINAGSSNNENMAFAYTELGKLNLRNDFALAKTQFNAALEIRRDYPPALEWLGKIAYFEGNFSWAVSLFEKAYAKIPLVQYIVDLADIYTLSGDTIKANQNLTLAKISLDIAHKSWVNNDLESSLFLSEHDMDLPAALEKAKKSYTERPNIYVADALSWALYKNQQIPEAVSYRKEIFRIWENDATILYHQGMIALANGEKDLAKKYLSKALSINPYFSLLESQKTREVLKSLL